MEHTGNTTDNHSEANRKSSRVVDVSWAADYLDDAWENDHSAKGAYDTQVIPPLSRYTGSEPDQRENRSLSETQEFKADKEDEDDDDVRIVDAFTDQTLVTS